MIEKEILERGKEGEVGLGDRSKEELLLAVAREGMNWESYGKAKEWLRRDLKVSELESPLKLAVVMGVGQGKLFNNICKEVGKVVRERDAKGCLKYWCREDLYFLRKQEEKGLNEVVEELWEKKKEGWEIKEEYYTPRMKVERKRKEKGRKGGLIVINYESLEKKVAVKIFRESLEVFELLEGIKLYSERRKKRPLSVPRDNIERAIDRVEEEGYVLKGEGKGVRVSLRKNENFYIRFGLRGTKEEIRFYAGLIEDILKEIYIREKVYFLKEGYA